MVQNANSDGIPSGGHALVDWKPARFHEKRVRFDLGSVGGGHASSVVNCSFRSLNAAKGWHERRVFQNHRPWVAAIALNYWPQSASTVARGERATTTDAGTR